MLFYGIFSNFSYGMLAVIISYIASGILMFVGAFSFELFEIVPFGLDEVLRTTSDGVLILDNKGKILFLNEEVKKIFKIGKRPDPRSTEDLFAGPSLLKDRLIRSSEGFEETLSIDESYFDVKASEIKDQSGVTIGRLILLRNVTRRVVAEQKAEESANKLSLMNSVTRHDILNQLMVIEGRISLAESAKDITAMKRHISVASMAICNIERQIAFSKDYQDAGVRSAAWQDMSLIMARVRTQSDLDGVNLISEVDGIEIFADPLFEKVIYNLIDNSLKHGKNVTCISLISTVENGTFKLIYEDDGGGIPAEMKATLFQMGAGTHTGLGLFLIRRILDISHMSIEESGIEGKGVRFVISIPEDQFRIKEQGPAQ